MWDVLGWMYLSQLSLVHIQNDLDLLFPLGNSYRNVGLDG